MTESVVAAWYAPRPTLGAWLLWPFSLVFGLVVAIRRLLYRSGVLRAERVRAPVVVVGNITLGGSGKTPLVIALAEALRARGWSPGIVSRGYGGSSRAPRAVTADDDPAVVGDEPPIIAQAGFAVWIGRDRPAAARALLAANPQCDVIVSDDGLQHYRLARDVEIAVLDGTRGLGNGLLLPAGPLREPASRLAGVDAIVRLVADSEGGIAQGGRTTLMTQVPQQWRNLRDASRVADVATWRGAGVHAVAGIGHPERFFALLRAQGVVAAEHAFADHHAFVAADFAWPGATAILMTQKDAVKCAAFADERFWYLPVRASIDPALVALVEHKIRGSQTA